MVAHAVSLNFVGSTFERFVQLSPDCTTTSGVAFANPTAAQLSCLAFSLPSNFSAPRVDYVFGSQLASKFIFTDTNVNCGANNLISRLSTVYGRNISAQNFVIGTVYNNTESVAEDPHFLETVYIDFMLYPVGVGAPPRQEARALVKEDVTTCSTSWISTVTQAVEGYVLAYKNPICGPNAPRLIDQSETHRLSYSSASVGELGEVFFNNGNLKAAFADAYGVEAAAATYKMVSNTVFDIIVTSNVNATSADNSCVYEYVVAQRSALERNFTLVSYDAGAIQLAKGANFEDGCISAAVSGDGYFKFTNTSEVCGASDPGSRFQRYFSVETNWSYSLMDIANGVFNISLHSNLTDDRRRDAGDATFHFFDKSFLATTTSTTVIPTSTLISTAASTSAGISTVKVASSAVAQWTLASSSSQATSATAGKSSAAETVTVTTTVAVGYAAPTVAYYVAPAANNIYKGTANVAVVGLFTLIAALFLPY